MNWTTWWLFATTETVLCLTPGPAVLFVLSSALKSGARASLASNLGILTANAAYFALSATGLGALIETSSSLFAAVKWMGAAYLIFIGLRALLSKAGAIVPREGEAEPRGSKLFGGGFLVQISNPNNIIFFTAFLPQFLEPRNAIVPQIAILAATSLAIEFCVLLGYGLAAGRASEWARQPRYATWTNRVAGTLLIGAGAGLAAIRRT